MSIYESSILAEVDRLSWKERRKTNLESVEENPWLGVGAHDIYLHWNNSLNISNV